MPFVPRIVNRIIDDCEVPKAPQAIWEVPFPEFPLPPNLGFQCSVLYPAGKEPAPYEDYNKQSKFFKPPEPRVSGTPTEPKIDVKTDKPLNPDVGACDFTLEVNVPCISVYPVGKEKNFFDVNKESKFIVAPTDTEPKIQVVFEIPENIDRSPCDFNIRVDVPCITIKPSEASAVEPTVPKIASEVKILSPINPNPSVCDFSLEVNTPCITLKPRGKEPGFLDQSIESHLVQPPPVGRESVVDVVFTTPLNPEATACDFNVEVNVPCITVKPAGFFPVNEPLKSKLTISDVDDPEVIVRIEPSTRTNKGNCDFDIGVDIVLPSTGFCVDLRSGSTGVIDPGGEVCAAHPVLTPGYTQADFVTYKALLQTFAECWWKPVDTARAADDYAALEIAFDNYELAMVEDEVYLIPEYTPTFLSAFNFTRKNGSKVTYVDPELLDSPSLNTRVETTEDGGCSFVIASDLVLPDPCARVKSGTGDIADPGPAPVYPGPLPTYPTTAEKQTHAEYWWYPAQQARYLRDRITLMSAISIFESQVPEANRYLITDYYSNLADSTSYDKTQDSVVKFVPGLKDPKLATHVSKEEPTSCVFGISTDLVLPCVGVSAAGDENDCEDPGAQPADPGVQPDPNTTEWRILHAEYWWWAVEVAKFNKDEEAFDDALFAYEANVIAIDRYLVTGYSAHLANSMNKLACQDSTVEIVPADEPATAFVRIEQPDPESCNFTIGIDLKIPSPDIDPSDFGNATPFKAYVQDDDKAKAENGCVTIMLNNGRTQNFEVPGSTQQVAVGDQLVIKVYIKEGAAFDEITGYAAADIVVEYTTEASDMAAAWQKPVLPLPVPAAQPEVVVPLNGIAKNGGMIVGFMALDTEGEKVWTQVLNECVILDGRQSDPVNFRGIKKENAGVFIPPNTNPPTIDINQGAVLISFQDGQNKPWAFKVFTPAGIVPGEMVILDIVLTDNAYVAVPDNTKPKGIRYDFDETQVTILCTKIAFVDNDNLNNIPEQVVGTVNTVGVIGIYYPAAQGDWPLLAAPHWIQKFEGMFHHCLQKPILPIPAPLAPGTVLTSNGLNQQPVWDYPRYL